MKKKLPIIIGEDGNAHNTLSGNETNESGESLVNVIMNNNLVIIW